MNKIQEKMKLGKQVIGSFLNMGSGISAECMALAGMDFFIVDTEHSPFDLAEVVDCIKSTEKYDITPMVRIKEINRGNVLKMLDAGAKGLIIPGVRYPEEVRKLVEYGKYKPVGERGFCPTRCCGYGYGDSMSSGMQSYMDMCNREIMLLPQCETAECLDNIEEIISCKGIDGIFVGPFDLSIAMGIPGQFNSPQFIDALELIQAACAKENKPCFIFAPNMQSLKMRLAQGFHGITYSSDLNILTEGYKNAKQQAESGM